MSHDELENTTPPRIVEGPVLSKAQPSDAPSSALVIHGD
jgi:hypothetical protein